MRSLDEVEVMQTSGGGLWREIGIIAYQVGSIDAAFYGQIPPGTVLF